MSAIYSPRKGKKCALYLRVSLERQTEGYSIDGQKEYLTEWAAHEGMEVVDVYVDAGKSGKSIAGRDEFQRMLNDVETRKIDIDFVVVFKLSRFGRNAKDVLNTLAFLQQYGVNLLCKEDGLDSSTQMGKMMITILGAVAEMERENILAQTMLGRTEKARQGGWNGGVAPYGYTRAAGKQEKLQINEEEASVVRIIFDKFVNGNMGYSDIAAYLNQQGITKMYPPTANKHFTDWSTKQVLRILTNPAYIGKITFGKTHQETYSDEDGTHRRLTQMDNYIISDITHEPIVSDELFEQAQCKCKTMKDARTANRPTVGRPKKNLLTGMLKCPQCGCAMYASSKKNAPRKDGTQLEYVYYMCGHYSVAKGGQCSKNSIRADWIETEVVEYTKQLVRNPKFAEDIQSQIGQKVDTAEIVNEITSYQATVKKLERKKSNLERDIDNIVDDDRNALRKREDMNRRLDKIYDEIYDIEDKIADCELRRQAVEQQNISTDNIFQSLQAFDQFFDQMDSDEKRQVLTSLISEIRLHPKAMWRDGQNPIKSITYTFSTSAVNDDLLWGNIGHESSPPASPSPTRLSAASFCTRPTPPQARESTAYPSCCTTAATSRSVSTPQTTTGTFTLRT